MNNTNNTLEIQQLRPKLESLKTQQLTQPERRFEVSSPSDQLRLKLESPDDLYDAWWLVYDGITYMVLDAANTVIVAAIPPKDIPMVNDALRGDLSNFEEVMTPYLVDHETIQQAEAERKITERWNVTKGLEVSLIMQQEALANPSPTDFKEAAREAAREAAIATEIIALRKRLEAYEAEDVNNAAHAELMKAITVT
jgi:hypothetical protein